MIKRHLPIFALACMAAVLLLAGGAMAQTKITKPSGGLPFKITKSGSYFLAGNLAVTTKTNTAIVVKVSNVTINLNGFSITGLGANSSGIGIDASASTVTGVIIANGTITGYGTGIRLNSNDTVQNVQILNHVADGVDVGESSCVISNSMISGNGGTGLNFADSTSGYLNNILNNGSNVLGGTNMGGNVCSGTLCP